MSRAMASARQRRAGITTPEPVNVASNVSTPSSVGSGGLTLPQVISLVDTRLTKLEKFMNDTKERPPVERTVQFTEGPTTSVAEINEPISQILDDYNTRFMMLAEEIAELKDTVMKLQTYTMDVNKMLLEERVNVLSDLGEDKGMFTMGDDTTLVTNDINGLDQQNL